MFIILLLVFVGVFLALAYLRAKALVWTAAVATALLVISLLDIGPVVTTTLWVLFVLLATVLNLPPLRARLVSSPVLKLFRKILPPMSQTERDALEAGSVWWDGELFSGNPDWHKLLAYPPSRLSEEEQAFLDGPVEELCAMLDDWRINQKLNDLPPEVWRFIKENRFFGIIIPKEYGGLGFSARAHSEIVLKISSRSIAAAVTVMVPNSLGPAELLLRYGTQEQKDYYLPRLARGEEVPCFALTSPEAGSDASAIPDYGIVCRQHFNGQDDVLGLRVTWNKRYITLGPVATVLGLAFKARDPDGLLGDDPEPGITCALIPTNHPGVEIGRRHHPLGVGFQNGPNSGREVFIPMDWVIGGQQQVGKGWRMLMECLAAGRSISLPALSVGGAKFASLSMGAYGRIRKQFKTPIGFFEGIEEALARIGGNCYMMDAARTLTTGALDSGESPSVISAILKYQLTERMRQAINDAMDIQGGAGICQGPHNILGRIYQAIPISITVEGANILTRSLIIYGQGAIRCHPYVLAEIQAAQDFDQVRAQRNFDRALWGHVGFVLSNFARALCQGVTGARLVHTPEVAGETRRYYQQLSRYSAAFAFLSDMAMLSLGGALKRKEKLSGRFADVLSLLYLCSATLKRYEDEGRQQSDLPLVRWACEDSLHRIEQALDGLLSNFPNRPLAWLLRRVIFPTGRHARPPSDRLGRKVARFLLTPSEARNRLVAGVYIPSDPDQQIARMEAALAQADIIDALEKRLFRARKKGEIEGWDTLELLQAAHAKGLVSDEEAEQYRRYDALRREIIRVDDFAPNEFRLES